MIRPLKIALALWRSMKRVWTDWHHDGPKDEEGDCPITDYTKAIESKPNDASAYLARGTAHLEALEFDDAIADLTKALEIKPNDDSAYTQRGGAHFEKAAFSLAIADLTRAIELNPKSALAYCNLGWTYEAMGDEKKPSFTTEGRLSSILL
jgi:tetratricopeptide (TPR) repeat protein